MENCNFHQIIHLKIPIVCSFQWEGLPWVEDVKLVQSGRPKDLKIAAHPFFPRWPTARCPRDASLTAGLALLSLPSISSSSSSPLSLPDFCWGVCAPEESVFPIRQILPLWKFCTESALMHFWTFLAHRNPKRTVLEQILSFWGP